jgi:hypothetical protein
VRDLVVAEVDEDALLVRREDRPNAAFATTCT